LDAGMKDEDPSDEDVERFSGETAYCPDCGAEIWDAAEVCPKCFAYLGGNTSIRSGVAREKQRRAVVALVIILIVLLVIGCVFWWVGPRIPQTQP
jgi:hypothetical protein